MSPSSPPSWRLRTTPGQPGVHFRSKAVEAARAAAALSAYTIRWKSVRISGSACLGAFRSVTLRIEETSDGENTILRLSGRIQSEALEELKAQIAGNGPGMVLDLKDVTLVDVDAVRFLSVCEAEGVELLHCSPYIRGWILRERA